MGRRKIKIEKVQETNAKQVTFSKRRLGLFKKASELSTLCNAEVGVVVFSPGDKPYSFGKPSFDVVAEKFTKGNEESEESDEEFSRRKKIELEKMHSNLNSIMETTDVEKKRREFLQKLFESGGDQRFMKSDEDLSLDELKMLKAKLESVLVGIEGNLDQIVTSSYLLLLSNGEENVNKDDNN